MLCLSDMPGLFYILLLVSHKQVNDWLNYKGTRHQKGGFHNAHMDARSQRNIAKKACTLVCTQMFT